MRDLEDPVFKDYHNQDFSYYVTPKSVDDLILYLKMLIGNTVIRMDQMLDVSEPLFFTAKDLNNGTFEVNDQKALIIAHQRVKTMWFEAFTTIDNLPCDTVFFDHSVFKNCEEHFEFHGYGAMKHIVPERINEQAYIPVLETVFHLQTLHVVEAGMKSLKMVAALRTIRGKNHG